MMILENNIAVVLALIISVVHLVGEDLEEYITGYREQIVSFSSGVTITYIFLQLMPELNRIASENSELLYVFPLIGFSSIHILEKYLAKSEISHEDLTRDYGEIHSSFLFLYHAAIGYFIATLLAESTISGLLFFIPVIMHVAVSSLSVTELHESFVQRNTVKYLISAAPLLGVIAYKMEILKVAYFEPLFGAVIGMFFYVVIRDSIPKDEKGQPKEFVAGTLIYLVFILATTMM